MSRFTIKIGNTYQRLRDSEASLDRNGRYLKVYDWKLFVDVDQADANAIERVCFDLGASFCPSEFICYYPMPTSASESLRFSTRQQSYAMGFTVTVVIRGAGGSTIAYTHTLRKRHCETSYTFTENRPMKPLRMMKLPERNFGVELELTSDLTAHQIASYVSPDVVVVDNYRRGRETYREWKLVPDSSIQCSPFMPNCNTFELVSPILNGGEGLSQLHQILQTLDRAHGKLSVNHSMGLHVHVDVSDLGVRHLIKICQNFLKYEAVMDTFFPADRRSTSPNAQRYFQSHTYMDSTNRRRHDRLDACQSVADLVEVWSPTRYYKLNLQNLATGRQPTVEFRQHHAVAQYETVSAWVRFCVALVENSARSPRGPTPLKESRTVDEAFQCLFSYCIKDRALESFYAQRRRLAKKECCTSCTAGLGCRA